MPHYPDYSGVKTMRFQEDQRFWTDNYQQNLACLGYSEHGMAIVGKLWTGGRCVYGNVVRLSGVAAMQ